MSGLSPSNAAEQPESTSACKSASLTRRNPIQEGFRNRTQPQPFPSSTRRAFALCLDFAPSCPEKLYGSRVCSSCFALCHCVARTTTLRRIGRRLFLCLVSAATLSAPLLNRLSGAETSRCAPTLRHLASSPGDSQPTSSFQTDRAPPLCIPVCVP